MLYFAYGSNMSAERMKARQADFTRREAARLPGYEMRFAKRARGDLAWGAATIAAREEGACEGVLYEITEEGRTALDALEGYPEHYDRITVTVVLLSGERVEAATYIAQPRYVQEGLRPTRVYLNHLLAGRDLLPADYVRWLESVETLDD